MVPDLSAVLPYCGAPPTIATLAGRWNLDPRLLAALVIGVLLYRSWARRHATAAQTMLFACGWAITALALVSPLCALSVSLFSARVGQHMILTLIAAPMVALGFPVVRYRVAGQEMLAAVAFAAALWAWHSPAPYDATFRSTAIYWTMHVTTWGAAVFFWWSVLRAPHERTGLATVMTIATGLQMALLGAVITWAPEPLYAPHLASTWAWGLSPLSDQQLGGTLMWAPGGLIFMIAIIVPLAMLMRRDGSAGPIDAMPGNA